MTAQPKLFCFGYGYVAERLAMQLLKQGWKVSATTREDEKKEMMLQKGIDAHLLNSEHPLSNPRRALEGTTHVLLSIPPETQDDIAFQFHAQDLLGLESLQWLGYLSATSVYGNRDGGWISEKTRPNPTSKRGDRRFKAEKSWLDLWEKAALPVHIFRLAGIYGPERSVLDTLRAGFAKRIDKPGQYFNRIHVDDIVQVLKASMGKLNPGSVYNLADDAPSESHELVTYACQLLGIEPPPLIPYSEANLTPMAASFYADNKRVKNEKIKEELGIQLLYPNYRVGLKACLQEDIQRLKSAS